jgi:hypothetical protein
LFQGLFRRQKYFGPCGHGGFRPDAGEAYHAFFRALEAASNVRGWSLPLLDPPLFSGLPLYPDTGQFFVNYDVSGVGPAGWAGFLFALAALTAVHHFRFRASAMTAAKADAKTGAKTGAKAGAEADAKTAIRTAGSGVPAGSGQAVPFALTLLFFLAAYLVFVGRMGNAYKVRKLAAYTALPLSVVPVLPLFSLADTFKAKFPLRPSHALAIVLALFFAVKVVSYPSLRKFPYDYFRSYPAAGYIETLSIIKRDFADRNYFLIHQFNFNHNLLAAMVMADAKPKLRFTHENYYFYGSSYYFGILYDNAIIISDYSCPKIVNAAKMSDERTVGNFYVYDLPHLQKKWLHGGPFRDFFP